MNDNLTLLGTGKAAGSGMSTLSVGTNDASGNGVAITQTDQSEQSYEVVIDASAPDTIILPSRLRRMRTGAGPSSRLRKA
jgi:hypothetical protein